MFGIALGQLLGGFGGDFFGPRPVFMALALWFAGTAWLMWCFAPRHADAPITSAGIGTIVMRFVSVLRVPWARVVLTSIFLKGVLRFGNRTETYPGRSLRRLIWPQLRARLLSF